MKCLVTGANGLVGSHVVRALLQGGHAVRALVRSTSDRTAIAGLPIELTVGNVLDKRSLLRAMRGCDLVFHAAAHFAYWGRSSDELDLTAVSGTTNVLTVARRSGVSRVLVTSSSVVVGYSLDPQPLDERSTAHADGETPYVQSKIRQDRRALEIARELDLELVLACPTIVVGPFAPSLGPSNSVMSTYLEDPLRLTYPGGCNIVAAADVGMGHVLVATRGKAGERYILGGENLEWRGMHALVSELCGTYGPSITAGHAACYLAAFGEEVRGRLRDRAPTTTRAQAEMVGRYYWYSHRKAGALGYAPMAARKAFAIALSWIAASRHISRETRTRLRLHEDVWIARARLRASEASLRTSA